MTSLASPTVRRPSLARYTLLSALRRRQGARAPGRQGVGAQCGPSSGTPTQVWQAKPKRTGSTAAGPPPGHLRCCAAALLDRWALLELAHCWAEPRRHPLQPKFPVRAKLNLTVQSKADPLSSKVLFVFDSGYPAPSIWNVLHTTYSSLVPPQFRCQAYIENRLHPATTAICLWLWSCSRSHVAQDRLKVKIEWSSSLERPSPIGFLVSQPVSS